MNFLDIFWISVIESITEFLPVSSTGHMIVVSELLSITQDDKFKAVEAIIQFPAILAILWIFRNKVNLKNKNLWFKSFFAFLPLGIIGFLFSDFIKSFFSLKIVAIMFIIGGIALLFTEKLYKKNKKDVHSINNLSYFDALKIGLFQVLAFLPGTSRSGATIFGGMFLGYNRKITSEFSFILAVPTMSVIFVHDFIKYYEIFTIKDLKLILFSSVIVFLGTYISVKLFMKFLEKFSLSFFGFYRIIFGLILLVWFL